MFFGRIPYNVDEWARVTGIHDCIDLDAVLESGCQVSENMTVESFGSYFESTISASMTFKHNVDNIPVSGLLRLLRYPALCLIEQDFCSHLPKPILPVEIGVAGVRINITVSIETSLSKFYGVNRGSVLIFEIHEMLL